MKVSDLPSNADLTNTKIRVPAEHKRMMLSAGLDTDEVYMVSSWFNGIWVKTDPKSQRMYPLTGVHPSSVLEWEVVE